MKQAIRLWRLHINVHLSTTTWDCVKCQSIPNISSGCPNTTRDILGCPKTSWDVPSRFTHVSHLLPDNTLISVVTPHECHCPLASSKVQEKLCIGEPYTNES